MQNQVDARGLPCPQPVLLVRKALADREDEGVVQVLVDDAGARDNVERFASSQGWQVNVEGSSGEWELFLTKGFECPVQAPQVQPVATASAATSRGVVYIRSATVGEGDPELGRILMHAFLATFKEVDPLPTHLIFVNGGVRLTTEGSEVLEDIRALAERGVKVLSCGTCLDFFDLQDQLLVGEPTNTFEVASLLMQADRVVTP